MSSITADEFSTDPSPVLHELNDNQYNMMTDIDLSSVYKLQDELHSQIDCVQQNTSHLLLQHQNDLFHEFHIKINELNQQLQYEKSLNQSGSVHWIELSNKLKSDNTLLTQQLIECKNKLSVEKSNNKQLHDNLLRLQSDHTYMVQQVHACKQHIAQLQLQLKQHDSGSGVK